MKKSREFDNILDECLERLLTKGETLEQCLESYPEQAAELRPLLETALVTKRASVIQPRPKFIARGVVVHPLRPWLGLERVSGTIEEINEPIITIDTTDIEYDDETIIVLRGGILAVETGKEAIAFCRKQEDGTLLAKLILVGIDLPGVQAELGRLGPPQV